VTIKQAKQQKERCPQCKGSGLIGMYDCDVCRGNGQLEHPPKASRSDKAKNSGD